MGTRTQTTEETLPQLAVGVAHDLRNVLFVVNAHCNRLSESLEPGDPRLDDVRAITSAVDRGADLARQFLATTRGRATAGMPVAVNEVITGIEPLLRRLVGDRTEVATLLQRDLWSTTATRTQIEQIVMNLVVNARDAMPAGGRLLISTENRSVAMPGQPGPAQYVAVIVTDTGVGMDADVQARMFDIYFTTKGSEGTGVGLSTVRAIAMLHDGHVEVSSVPGEGTTVRVVLPRAGHSRPAMAPTRLVGGDAVALGRGERVLLIDDEPAVRDMLVRSLEAHGYDPVVASNGTEALALCDQADALLDLLVTDVNLPDIHGCDVARTLRARMPGLRVVFISGEGTKTRDVATSTGSPVLTKPFSISEFTRVVRRALDSRPAA